MLSRTYKWLKSWVITEPARSAYAYNSDTLDRVITDQEWLELLINEHDPRIVNVTLKSLKYDNRPDLGFRFKLGWGNRILSSCPLVLFFPNHPDKDQHVLYTDKMGSLADLDTAINDRIQKSKMIMSLHEARLPLLAVASGPYIYRIWDIDRNHNIYVYWLTSLNKYNVTGQCDPLKAHVPAIVEMDGDTHMINMVPLDFEPSPERPEKYHPPLNLQSHERSYITIQGSETLFNLEKPPSRYADAQNNQASIKTVSQTKAANDIRAMNMDAGFHTLCAEALPLDNSCDYEDSASEGSGNREPIHYVNTSSRSGSDYGEDSDHVIGQGMLMELMSPDLDVGSPRAMYVDSSDENDTAAHHSSTPFVPDEPVYTSEDSRDSASSK